MGTLRSAGFYDMTAFAISIVHTGEILLQVVTLCAEFCIGMRVAGRQEIAPLRIVGLPLPERSDGAVLHPLPGRLVAAAALFGINFAVRMVSFRNKRFNRVLPVVAAPKVLTGRMGPFRVRKRQISGQRQLVIILEKSVSGGPLDNPAMHVVNDMNNVRVYRYAQEGQQYSGRRTIVLTG